MHLTLEQTLELAAAIITLLLLIFVVDWRYFRDWIVVFLFKSVLDFIWGSSVVEMGMIQYPIRLLPENFDTCILFELWVFPVLCILYNQVTREKAFLPIIGYALLFSAGITMVEYPLERYTDLIKYIKWSWLTTFCTVTITFLISRAFLAFFRWGCIHFDPGNGDTGKSGH